MTDPADDEISHIPITLCGLANAQLPTDLIYRAIRTGEKLLVAFHFAVDEKRNLHFCISDTPHDTSSVRTWTSPDGKHCYNIAKPLLGVPPIFPRRSATPKSVRPRSESAAS